MKSKAERYHDRVAGIYDASYEGAYWKLYDTVTWKHLKPFLPRDTSAAILDAGCGTGKWGLKLAKSGFRVTLSDLSPKMLEAAAEKRAREGIRGETKYAQADICDLAPFANGSFDFVCAQGDPVSLAGARCADALRAISRVLKPGGMAVISVDNRCHGLDHFARARDWHGLDRFLRTGMTEWLAKRDAERFPMKMFLPAEAAGMCRAAGLEVLSMIGKTVIPLPDRSMLEDEAVFREVLRLELEYNGDRDLLCLAGHLQIALKKAGG